MNKTELMTTIGRKFHMAGFKLKKASPEILVVSGIAGVVASTVMACKATTKVNDILDKHAERMETIKHIEENPDKATPEEKAIVEDPNKFRTNVYLGTGLEFVKLYGPSIALGALSITAILAGHNILRKRNVALAAAYTAVDKSFKEYRGRVVERFGEALDKELRYNIKTKEVEEVVVNEDGTESVVKTTANEAHLPEYSLYSKFFDASCAGWTKDPEYNRMFLQQQEQYANQRLKEKGYLFLNDVYDMLGFDRTKAGQVVGWVYDEKHPVGDNRVSFCMYQVNDPANRRFINGTEPVVLLDFNVDGEILNLAW